MLARTRDLVFEFAKEASKFKVAYIFLFGSVAREEEDKRSDVDILVVFETKKDVEDLKDKKEVSNLALDLEKKYDKNLQIVFTNKNFEGLDSYFLEQVLREGILLYANSFPIQIKNFKLESYSLISYSLKNLSKPDKMRVIKALHGYKTLKRYKGKIYESSGKGLIYYLDASKIGIATILVPRKNAKLLKQALERFKVDYEEIDLWLSATF